MGCVRSADRTRLPNSGGTFVNVSTRGRRLGVAALATCLAVGAVACGGQKKTAPTTEPPTTATPTTVAAPTTAAPTTAAPTTTNADPNAFDVLSDPNAPFHVFMEAMRAAGLESLLQGPGPITVFVPPDPTFQALFDVWGTPKEEVFADIELLKKVISYHVVNGQNLTTESLLKMDGQDVATLEGENLRVHIQQRNVYLPGDNPFEPGGVHVNVAFPVSNGFVHLLDWVLLPPDVDVRKFERCKSGETGCVVLQSRN